ncbi:leucine-rich repeat protein [Treponema sp.]|uniref:leucine-rich repeat protein n=1 Tax=Treponema sp. TaxID=166 RepID=UPI0025EBE256|nr:leucine-rich repeat protein [Treponema sp.]MCR5218166.1 leucine-rich repeat protein [Treponema sp.]
MKGFYRFFAFVAVLSLFSACSDLSIEEDSSKKNNGSSKEVSAPGIYLTATDPNGNKIGGGESSSRNASPVIDGGWSYYGVLVTSGTVPDESTKLQKVTYNSTSGSLYYPMNKSELDTKGNMDLYVYGFPSSQNTHTAVTASLYLKSTISIDGASLAYTTSGKFAICTGESETAGYGTINLKVNVSGTNIEYVTYTVKMGTEGSSTSGSSTVSDSILTINPKDDGGTDSKQFSAGTYTLTMSCYNSNGGNLIYYRTETVEVWPGCETNTWYTGNGIVDELSISSDSLFKTYFVCGSDSYFYGNSLTSYTNASDTNTGGIGAPLATVGEAVNRILAANDGTSEYMIYLDGTDTSVSSSKINITETSKALNLTIKSLTSSQAVLNGYSDTATSTKDSYEGALLNISGKSSTDTKINLENIKICGHNNSASDGTGGGIYSSKATITLTNCIISGNQAANGGGIYHNGNITMNGGRISGNTATSNGGGVAVVAGTSSNASFYMKGTAVIGDSSATSTATSSDVCSNSANLGAGIYVSGGSLYIGYTADGNEDGNFEGGVYYNFASSNGGGVYADTHSVVKMSGGTIGRNAATSNGGGVYTLGSLYLCGSAVIGDSTATTTATVNDNSNSVTNGNGGGIYSSGGSVYIGYTADEDIDNDFNGGVYYNYASNHGGGVYAVDNSVVKMSGGYISANMAYLNGGGIYTSGRAFISSGQIMKNDAFQNRGGMGGGIYNAGNLFVYGDTLIGHDVASDSTWKPDFSNFAVNGGGGVYNQGSFYLGYKTATEKDATSTCKIFNCYGGYGGGVYNDGSFYFAYGVIENNTSKYNAGAVYNYGNIYLSCKAYIPAGYTDKNGTKSTGVKMNDVYMKSISYNLSLNPITITGALTPPEEANGVVATITPEAYTEGTQVLGDNNNSSYVSSNYMKFVLAQEGYAIDNKGTVQKGYLADTAPAYISTMTESGTVRVFGYINTDTIAAIKTALYTLYENKPTIRVKLDLSQTTGLTELPEKAFSNGFNTDGCLALECISLPEGITKINNLSFCNCKNLTTVTIPSTVTEIGRAAFYSTGLTGILNIPNSVKKFGYQVFYNTPDDLTLQYEDQISTWIKYKENGTEVTNEDLGNYYPYSGVCPTKVELSTTAQGDTYIEKSSS